MISPTNRIVAAFAVVMLTFATHGRGQAPTSQTWNNASGDFIWNQGGNTTTNKGFNDWTGSLSSGTWNGGYNNASFGTTGAGTVTVDDSGTGGNVTLHEFLFTGGTHVFSGDPIYDYSSTATIGAQETFMSTTGSGTVTFNSKLVFGDLMSGNEQAYINGNSTTNVNFSAIDFGPGTYTGSRRLQFQATGGTMTFNGPVTATGGHGGQVDFNNQGTYTLAAGADFTGFTGGAINSFAANTINFYTSKFTSAQTFSVRSATATFNFYGAQNIPLAIYDSTKGGSPQASDNVNITYGTVMNQATADISTWSGNTNLDGSNMSLSAVAGGRLIMSGAMNGNAPAGLVISGSGTVVLSAAAGNAYDERDGAGKLQATSTVAATLKSGSTTLITNTSGSAFGGTSTSDGTYVPSGTYKNPVKIESTAILGGTGISTAPIQALAAGSIIAPGDFGQASLGIASSIGKLTLKGGLIATSGATLDFKLNGLTYDSIDFGGTKTVKGGALTLDNTITFNLTGTPVISAANNNGTYNFLTGLDLTDSTEGTNFNFQFNAPNGYKVVGWDTHAGSTIGGTDGNNDFISVQIALAPEPSTYGLLGLGLLGLVAVRRFRRLSV